MKRVFELWRAGRIQADAACAVEPEMRCMPLPDDPICGECFDGDCEKADGKGGRDAVEGHK